MKQRRTGGQYGQRRVAPLRGRGLKLPTSSSEHLLCGVAPLRGRGLKPKNFPKNFPLPRRPPAGAWIETTMTLPRLKRCGVAPLRGRGLKHLGNAVFLFKALVAPLRGRGLKQGKTYQYTWSHMVAPLRGRGLKPS